MPEIVPAYSILMVVHNQRAIVQLATTRILRQICGLDARLVVVDNASTDGVSTWLRMLARRGDIDLITSQIDIGHGPALELARAATSSPYLLTLASDAFPLTDDWLTRMRSRLNDHVRAVGIRHCRGYLHPACMMIARETLDRLDLPFLGGPWPDGDFDVGERVSFELRRGGLEIAGLEPTSVASLGEPGYCGAEYERLIYHHGSAICPAATAQPPADDAAPGRALAEPFASYHAEPRDVTVVIGIRAIPHQAERLRNARVCLEALNQQTLERWRYRLIVVEQDDIPRIEAAVAPLIDRYVFAYNRGPYNRGWGFNIAAMQPGVDQGALCLMDADFLVPSDFLQSGLQALAGGARAVIPYREVIYLDVAATDQVISTWQASARVASHMENQQCAVFSRSVGGSMWIDGTYYRASGGHNEEFRGWGAEDREFYNRLSRDAPIPRLPARIYHLYHPRASGHQEAFRRNRALLKRIESYPQPAGRIGDPRRYEAERPTAQNRPITKRRSR